MTDDFEIVRRVASEWHADALRRALKNAVNGTAHWRYEAQQLLGLIDNGVMPPPREKLQPAKGD